MLSAVSLPTKTAIRKDMDINKWIKCFIFRCFKEEKHVNKTLQHGIQEVYYRTLKTVCLSQCSAYRTHTALVKTHPVQTSKANMTQSKAHIFFTTRIILCRKRLLGGGWWGWGCRGKQRWEVARGNVLLSIWIGTTTGDRERVWGACKSGHAIKSEIPGTVALTWFRCVPAPFLKKVTWH